MTNAESDAQLLSRLEYELIHTTILRRSVTAMRWQQITIPVSAVIVTLFLVLDRELWGIGWLIGLALLAYGKRAEKDIEFQIARLYARIIELERELGMTFYCEYLFRNLNRKLAAARTLPQLLGSGSFNYEGLLEIARSHPDSFVRPRGRHRYLLFVLLYGIAGFILALAYYLWLLSEWAGGFT